MSDSESDDSCGVGNDQFERGRELNEDMTAEEVAVWLQRKAEIPESFCSILKSIKLCKLTAWLSKWTEKWLSDEHIAKLNFD